MNSNEQSVYDKESIDLVEILQLFWRHKLIIIVLVILAASFMFIRTSYFTSDVYTSNGILYVSNKSEDNLSTETGAGSIKRSDIDTSRALSATYMELLRTRSFLEDVANDYKSKYKKDVPDNKKGSYSWRQISNMSIVASVNDTELLLVSVSAPDPNDAYAIAASFVEKAPQKLLSVYKSGEVYTVDEPRIPSRPNSKNTVQQTFIGALVGLLIGLAFVFIRNFFDNRVHSSEDVLKRYDITILGETFEHD